MTTVIATSVDIAADPEAVWDVLTDFAAYGDWNPFMDRVQGTSEVGSRLVVHLHQAGRRGMTFRPTVVAAVPGQELRWVGKLGPGGLFDGEHSFVLTRNADGTTHLDHGEVFSGVLVSLLRGMVKNSDAGFPAFNAALKERVESARPR